MQRVFFLLLILLVGISLAGEKESGKDFIIKGKVIGDDEKALADCKITFLGPAIRDYATTDKDGKFSKTLSFKPTTLVLEHRDYVMRFFHLPPELPDKELTIMLDSGGVVEGEVVDEEGKPVADATAYCAGKIVKSDKKGKFLLRGVKAGVPYLLVQKEGFARYLKRVDVKRHEKTTVKVQLEKGYFIEGQVVDEEGKPVPDAMVVGYDSTKAIISTAKSDKEGHFRLDYLPKDTTIFEVIKRGVGYYKEEDPCLDVKGKKVVLKMPKGVQQSESAVEKQEESKVK